MRKEAKFFRRYQRKTYAVCDFKRNIQTFNKIWNVKHQNYYLIKYTVIHSILMHHSRYVGNFSLFITYTSMPRKPVRPTKEPHAWYKVFSSSIQTSINIILKNSVPLWSWKQLDFHSVTIKKNYAYIKTHWLLHQASAINVNWTLLYDWLNDIDHPQFK